MVRFEIRFQLEIQYLWMYYNNNLWIKNKNEAIFDVIYGQ